MRLPSNFSRRAFITGIGGATVALPFLPSLLPRDVKAATERPRYCVYVRQANGCAQADNGEPERFWPVNLGQLTSESMSTVDAERAKGLRQYFGEDWKNPHLYDLMVSSRDDEDVTARLITCAMSQE